MYDVQELDVDVQFSTIIGSHPDNVLLNRFASITVCKYIQTSEIQNNSLLFCRR